MAYADYDFYSGVYFGELSRADGIEKWLEQASDELDIFTFGRLMDAFPTEATHVTKVRKAVCAIADALYQVDAHRKAATPQSREDGSFHGAVSSVTSGGESISYSSVASGGSVYADAAASREKEFELVRGLVYKYLSNIPDATGTNLLYAGVG